MADEQGRGRRRKAPVGDHDDGATRVVADGAAPELVAAGEGLGSVTAPELAVTHAAVFDAANAAEQAQGPFGNRIVRVFCTEDSAPELWRGVYGSAVVEVGVPGYQLSSGERIAL